MREIVLDTETTGLSPKEGHRIFEIGCVELINKIPTGKVFHHYLDPQRELSQASIQITGIQTHHLIGKPVFKGIVDGLLEFLGDDPLIIHNAPFDMGFLNHEFLLLGLPEFSFDRVKDTLLLARQKFPGSPASLDALCKRFEIDLSERNLHGALLDANLLAQVYLELTGGRQIFFDLQNQSNNQKNVEQSKKRKLRQPRVFPIAAEELQLHEKMIIQMKKPLWVQNIPERKPN